ncbi:MAG: S9 family peptidase [Acidobacteria bacterium]|nr:S9 family peptidase [Acidobacteriota bacterium]
MHARIRSAALGLAAALLVTQAGLAQQAWKYPATATVEHVDTYHGVQIADPYRWLEDDNSAQTTQWVEAQNAVTFGYLGTIPFRAALRARLDVLQDYPKYTAPSRRGTRYFFSKNSGLQEQSVLFTQVGLDGTPEVLLDPNTFSKDGTSRLTTFSPSLDGKYAVYGVSRSGSDWQDYLVIDLATKKTLADKVEWVKVSGVAWRGNGFFYSRYPAPKPGQEKSGINENHQVYFHTIGTPQSADTLVYDDPKNPQRFHGVRTTEDERFAILTISDRGKGKKGNAVFVRDFSKNETTFKPLIGEIGDDSFSVVDNVGGLLLVETDRNAPNGRVVQIDPANPAEANWKTIIAERPEPLQNAATAGDKLFLTYLKDASTRAYVHALDGTFEHEIALPGVGSANGFGGERDDTAVFYSFSSYETPASIYRYDIATKKSTVFRAPEIKGYDPSRFETRQVFYTSKDGTKVPMFVVHRKGVALDGTNPTVLYGYGGFNISQTPSFSPSRIALLEQGVVYAVANLRGGGEYGERWHEAGTKLKKQNVFDDCIAAAEWLIANKYTTSERLAVQGGSNGGLLVGAVINQRPDLFRVAFPQVGVMDMLRFHKFTIGWNWVADYGSSDNAEEFKALRAYSPLHNIRTGARYPSTLITTADHDDRVVPAHSFKYAATLQKAASPERPVLIRIETVSGHGASNVTKTLETNADLYAFLFQQMGITPKVPASN